jgi:hypothetical protein
MDTRKLKAVEGTFQQGDVKGRRVTTMPVGEPVIIQRRRIVVAHGESGHSHVVEDDDAELIRIGERLLLSIPNGGTVVHEEHKPIKLAPGIWEVGQVREYDYFQQMSRTVRD